MGVFLGNGYHICVPSFTLTGSLHTFQVALMGKTSTGDNVAATLAKWVTALTTGTGPIRGAIMYVGWSNVSIKVSQMDGGFLTVAENLTVTTGTLASSLGVPCNVSILTRKPVALAGRRYRGRCMWPDMWVPESDISQAGLIGAAGQTTVNTIMSGMHSSLASAGIDEVLGHSSSEILPTVLTSSMICVPRVGTIKRRIRGSS